MNFVSKVFPKTYDKVAAYNKILKVAESCETIDHAKCAVRMATTYGRKYDFDFSWIKLDRFVMSVFNGFHEEIAYQERLGSIDG